MHRMKLI